MSPPLPSSHYTTTQHLIQPELQEHPTVHIRLSGQDCIRGKRSLLYFLFLLLLPSQLFPLSLPLLIPSLVPLLFSSSVRTPFSSPASSHESQSTPILHILFTLFRPHPLFSFSLISFEIHFFFFHPSSFLPFFTTLS